MDSTEPSLEIGKPFLAFWVNRLIGRGGIGEVYEISHKGRREALKVIQAKWLGDESLKQRMVDEGLLLERVKHPNVVQVHETGVTVQGTVWIRMEFLNGHTLRDVMQRRGLLSVALACTYMRAAGHAAHQCHVMNAIHRDIKPENLFIINPDETVKLLDFGIAKLYGSADTVDGQRHGTPLYMAPEQIRGHRVTPATDVYALGLVTYEMLCGAHPFVEDPRDYDLYTLYHKHFSETPASLTSIGIPPEIADVVAKALAKDPSMRYPIGLDFAEALWRAWRIVSMREPEWDTEPGEPSREVLMQQMDNLQPPVPTLERASRPSIPQRMSQTHRALAQAKSERLPQGPLDPETVLAYLTERASQVMPAPRTGTELLHVPCAGTELLPASRCERSASEPSATEIAFPAPKCWVPVSATVPVMAFRDEPVNSTTTLPISARPASTVGTAATLPFVPPPPRSGDDVKPSVTSTEPRWTSQAGPHPRVQAWAEAPDLERAGIRPVAGMLLYEAAPPVVAVPPASVLPEQAPSTVVVVSQVAQAWPSSWRRWGAIVLGVMLMTLGLYGAFSLGAHMARRPPPTESVVRSPALPPSPVPSPLSPSVPAPTATEVILSRAPASSALASGAPTGPASPTTVLPTATATSRPTPPPVPKVRRLPSELVDPW